MSIKIDVNLVRRLIATQISQWKDLDIRPVAQSGWDNRIFHLGETMLVRIPSAAKYAGQVEKDFRWLPILSPLLPLQIPTPLIMGEPTQDNLCLWGVYRWLEGETVAATVNFDVNSLAKDLAGFLKTLQSIDSTSGPLPGKHNFYRGGSLAVYDDEARKAINLLSDKIDTDIVAEIWQVALDAKWHNNSVWVHGDIAAGNLLLKEGRLNAIIDFGQLAIGDPACDLVIAWTLFQGESRKIFRDLLSLDTAMWARARGWALWKALIIASGISQTNAIEGAQSWRIINEIISDHRALIRVV